MTINMTGKRFSSIVALNSMGKATSGDLKWLFACDCGNIFEANGYYARSGKIISCPSCSRERTRIASVMHGMTETVEFSTWTDIKTRCYNKNGMAYKNYGGRGIKVCDRWLSSFENFLSDMGERPSKLHSIDRINNNGNYEPSNCRWATIDTQASNKRSNNKITIDGITKNRAEWAKLSGVGQSTILLRQRRGISGNDLLQKTGGSVTLNGITDTYDGWSKKTGIKMSTIYMRINSYKWPIEKALNKGELLCKR